MQTALLIFKIVGFALLGVLALAILLLVIPMAAYVKYEDKNFEAYARVLGLKFKIYPLKTAKKAVKKAEKEVKKEEKQVKNFDFKLIFKLLPELPPIIRRLMRGIKLSGIDLVFPVAAAEPYDTAVDYGRTSGWIYSAAATLNRLFKTDYKRFKPIPDFTGEFKDATFFSCRISALPISALVAGISLLIKIAQLNLDKEGVSKHGEASYK